MTRLNSLTRYQQGLILVLAAMVLVFSVVYPIVLRREGFAYGDALLIPSVEDGTTFYTGKVEGEPAQFTVSPEKIVQYRVGNSDYGPYIAVEDPTAIPADLAHLEHIRGVELRCKEKVIFRGGLVDGTDRLYFYREDGRPDYGTTITSWDGTMMDSEGNVVDPWEPDPFTILKLIQGPELTHRGHGIIWFYGVLLCLIGAVNILFAEEIFRWKMSFRVRNSEAVEPSDWELADRYIGWTLLTGTALVLFWMGLR